jgi:cadmium resistance protein CadD (predicted permease)
MFLLFDVATQGFILGYVPEPLEVLIFAIGLILLTIGLRWLLKRDEKNTDGEIRRTTEQN